MRTPLLPLVLSVIPILVCGCERRDDPPAVASAPASTPADAFFSALGALCGQAYAGALVVADARDRETFAGTPVAHVRECSDEEIRIPLHVGEDRSRTWIVSRVDGGLRLKHDHRHRDGSEDRLTQYGGDSLDAGSGTATRQAFPADADSKTLFLQAGLTASVDNIWALEVEPGERLAYELRRPDRHFRVEFDLTRPVAAPPAPWGQD